MEPVARQMAPAALPASVLVVVLALCVGCTGHSRHQARPTVTVPGVVGLSFPEAVARLDDAGLCFQYVRLLPGRRSRIGTVVAESPAAGARAERLDAVRLGVRFQTPKAAGRGTLTFALTR